MASSDARDDDKPQSTFYFALVAALVLAAFALLPRLSIGRHPLMGKAAPAFSLEVVHNGEAGARLDLEKFKGHPVILDFWATWCGPCRVEAPILSRVAERYKDRGLVVVGVNTNDKPGLARAFAADKKLSYPIVFDEGSDVGERYGVSSLPTLVLVGKDGTVRAVKTGIVDEASLEAMISAEL